MSPFVLYLKIICLCCKPHNNFNKNAQQNGKFINSDNIKNISAFAKMTKLCMPHLLSKKSDNFERMQRQDS